MANQQVIGADVTRRPALVSFDNYLEAQKTVDKLSDEHFPVQYVAIVGVDLRLVESVLGRMSWARAALGGMATFAWFGVLIGLFVSFFGSENSQALQLIVLGLLFGAAFGIVFGMVSYAFTGGRRDFVSRQALQAARYDVLCDGEHIGEARRILGLVPAWPPQPPSGSTAPGTDVPGVTSAEVTTSPGATPAPPPGPVTPEPGPTPMPPSRPVTPEPEPTPMPPTRPVTPEPEPAPTPPSPPVTPEPGPNPTPPSRPVTPEPGPEPQPPAGPASPAADPATPPSPAADR